MGNISPGYKSYKVPGCNGVIPGWLIKHRGEEIDRAVTAATNALVEADLLRNISFPSENANPIINSSKSFKLLSIIPTEIPDIGNVSNTCLDNQFEFSLIDERFINKDKISYTDDDLRSVLRYKEDSTKKIPEIIEEYKADNPSRSTLWGSIKAARDILLNQPLSSANSNAVLLIDESKAIWGKINSDYVADDAILTKHISDGQITTDKIANVAVTTDKLADASITTVKINNSAVTENKIKNDAVTEDKIKDGSITNDKLGSDVSAKLQKLTNDVAGFKGSLSIDPTPAATAGVVKRITYNSSDGKFSVAYSTVTTDDIADANITKEKIADGSIHSEHLSADLITYLENLKPSEPSIGDDVILDCGEFITLDASATPSNPDDGVQEDDIIFNCGNTEE